MLGGYTRQQINGIDPATLPPHVIASIAQHAMRLSLDRNGVNRVELEKNIVRLTKEVCDAALADD